MEFLASLAIKALVGTSICGTITVGTIYKCDRTLLGFSKDDTQTTVGDKNAMPQGNENPTGTGGSASSSNLKTPVIDNNIDKEVANREEQEGAAGEESEKQEDVNDDEAKVSVDGETEGVKTDHSGQASSIEILPSVNQTGQNSQSDIVVTSQEQQTQVTPVTVSQQPQTETDAMSPVQLEPQPQPTTDSEPSDQPQQQ